MRVAELSVLFVFGIWELQPRFSSVRRRGRDVGEKCGVSREATIVRRREDSIERQQAFHNNFLPFFPSSFSFSSAELTGAIPSFLPEITNIGTIVGGKYLGKLVLHVCVIFKT